MASLPATFGSRNYPYSPPSERLGVVYFVRDGAGAVKIGFTSDSPDKRLAALQTSNPNKLELVGFFAARKCDETTIHRMFRRHRLKGEWFKESELTLSRVVGKLYARICVLEREIALMNAGAA